MRIKDETLVDPEDEEVLADELTDELSSYFKCERIPKILITTSSRPKCHVSMKGILCLRPIHMKRYKQHICNLL